MISKSQLAAAAINIIVMTTLNISRGAYVSSFQRIVRINYRRPAMARIVLPRYAYAGKQSEQEAEPPIPPEAIQSLLWGTMSRAKRTLSETNDGMPQTENNNHGDSNIDNDTKAPHSPPSMDSPAFSGMEMLGDAAVKRAEAILATKNNGKKGKNDNLQKNNGGGEQSMFMSTRNLAQNVAGQAKRSLSTTKGTAPNNTKNNDASNNPKENEPDNKRFETTDLRYGQNPAISFTALAQWLWASVLKPHEDVAIDATCGNGYDSAGIASLLFSNEDLYLDKQAELVCVDIQQEACQKTEEALSKVLNPWTMKHQVQIFHGSHAPLPLPRNTSSVGLVVYNLGYLPKSGKEFITQVESTVVSITDALMLIRVGGMVSIMTYPKTNAEEDFAVRTLLEASVLIVNKQGPKWYTYMDELDCSAELKELLMREMRRMSTHYKKTGERRTFRVSEHKKIGLAQAPILLTATRIK